MELPLPTTLWGVLAWFIAASIGALALLLIGRGGRNADDDATASKGCMGAAALAPFVWALILATLISFLIAFFGLMQALPVAFDPGAADRVVFAL